MNKPNFIAFWGDVRKPNNQLIITINYLIITINYLIYTIISNP